ncbi:isochorismatase [Alkalihalobacillus alcalophilus ATCC 27647 = CGMCC 1.3604]|uniref:Isochorismatase n=2 Tax=Alkalihalobacillus alcalophilus ATCC 27647 = CGMCC 1.3604 TaxID=1218173 RepID=A0A094XAG6_ALKAL|nr:isochorismatase family cysteine hydrolase [Alkalihalobacillus alcalophilus]KGA95745.1 isochorismatase [Alkalihalobacillus alcalophilus ATCC 27647 = CGMCC 1.3604]MED1563636.1 cysteine hydrolase [Alkalihalobacillus alcalophilus]
MVTNTTTKDHKLALLIIDMINDLEFESGDQLLKYALPAAHAIKKMKEKVKAEGFPVIYINDNYGQWQSDFRHLVRHCIDGDSRGKALAELLKPDEDDYFVLKPQFSGFFGTPLNILLEHLGVDTLILTGVAGNMCVQFTANDAYMYHYKLYIPSDCIASADKKENDLAIETMRQVNKADVRPSTDFSLKHF